MTLLSDIPSTQDYTPHAISVGAALLLVIKWLLDLIKNNKESKEKEVSEKNHDTTIALIKQEISQIKEEKKTLSDNVEKEVLAAKHSRSMIRKDIDEKIEKTEKIIHDRINKTQNDMKDYVKKVDDEIKDIKEDMGEIKQSMGKIDGKLDIVIAKMK